MEEKRYKTRLLLGEGDFSYAVALVTKHLISHPGLGRAITATAFDSEATLRQKYSDTFDQHVEFLRANNVRLLFNVDATKLHTHPDLANQQFDCIHFNFPHDDKSYETGTLRAIIGEFYKSARLVQKLNGRVYMALPKPFDERLNLYYKTTAYDLYQNTRMANYQFVKKRSFGKERYSDYGHVQTKGSGSANNAVLYPKEYVFKLTALTPEEILALDKQRAPKPGFDNKSRKYVIPEIKTDGDSTDYTFVDLAKENLYPIPSPEVANEWMSDLFSKKKKMFEEIEKGVSVELAKIQEFLKKLKSIEIYLTGTSKKLFYGHSSGLHWKNHIAKWHYRGVVIEDNTIKSSDANIQLKYRFISFLLEVMKSSSSQYTIFMMNALEALFYLYPYRPESIQNIAVAMMNQPDISYRCKAIALSILMKERDKPEFRHKTLIPLLLKSLGYDPRLDWLICSFLGHMDITTFMLDPVYRECLTKIGDFRLMDRMLKVSDVRKLHKKKKQLPHLYYQWLVTYLWYKKSKQALDKRSEIIEEAVKIPTVFSPCLERDSITFESRMVMVSPVPNIFMPAQSVVRDTILTNLEDRHQEVSFLTLGRNYLNGTNGCERNYRKALGYFKVPADNGSIEALYEMVSLYSKGLVDVSGDNLQECLQYCIKLQAQKEVVFSPEQQSVILNARALILLFQGDIKTAELCLNLSLRVVKENDGALFNQAVLFILQGNSDSAQKNLSQITGGYQIYVKGLQAFLSGDLEQTFRIFNRASDEQLSLMAMYCGVIAHKRGDEARALKCFSQALTLNSQHSVALGFCGVQTQKNTNKYELIFKYYDSKEAYLKEKDSLHKRCSMNRGFFVFIQGEAVSETLYLTVSEEKPIVDNIVMGLAQNIIRAFQEDNKAHVHASMQELHKLITHMFEVNPTPNVSLQLDEVECVRVIESQEELDQLERERLAAQRSPRVRLEMFPPGEEQDVPGDVEDVGVRQVNSVSHTKL